MKLFDMSLISRSNGVDDDGCSGDILVEAGLVPLRFSRQLLDFVVKP